MTKKEKLKLIELLSKLETESQGRADEFRNTANVQTATAMGSYVGQNYAYYAIKQYLLGNKGLLENTYKPFQF
jgi:hypothetical protein